MNINNINKLIDHLRKVDAASFNMGTWGRVYDYTSEEYDRPEVGSTTDIDKAHVDRLFNYQEGSCGTVACIAGHAQLIKAREDQAEWVDSDDAAWRAQQWLDIDGRSANVLFMGHGSGVPIEQIPLHDAILTLEYLRDTGEVDWAAAKERAAQKAQKLSVTSLPGPVSEGDPLSSPPEMDD